MKTVKQINAVTALYAFAGWLTSMDEPITFSSNHWAIPAADMVAEIIKANNLTGEVDFDNYIAPENFDFPVAYVNEAVDVKPVYTQTMKDNGELPAVGMECLINFPDIDNAWYEYTIDFMGEHSFIATCEDVSERFGHVEDVHFKPLTPPIVLEDGKAYQFVTIEDNTIHGIYNDDEHSFRGTCVEWAVESCTNIKLLTAD